MHMSAGVWDFSFLFREISNTHQQHVTVGFLCTAPILGSSQHPVTLILSLFLPQYFYDSLREFVF